MYGQRNRWAGSIGLQRNRYGPLWGRRGVHGPTVSARALAAAGGGGGGVQLQSVRQCRSRTTWWLSLPPHDGDGGAVTRERERERDTVVILVAIQEAGRGVEATRCSRATCCAWPAPAQRRPVWPQHLSPSWPAGRVVVASSEEEPRRRLRRWRVVGSSSASGRRRRRREREEAPSSSSERKAAACVLCCALLCFAWWADEHAHALLGFLEHSKTVTKLNRDCSSSSESVPHRIRRTTRQASR